MPDGAQEPGGGGDGVQRRGRGQGQDQAGPTLHRCDKATEILQSLFWKLVDKYKPREECDECPLVPSGPFWLHLCPHLLPTPSLIIPNPLQHIPPSVTLQDVSRGDEKPKYQIIASLKTPNYSSLISSNIQSVDISHCPITIIIFDSLFELRSGGFPPPLCFSL